MSKLKSFSAGACTLAELSERVQPHCLYFEIRVICSPQPLRQDCP